MAVLLSAVVAAGMWASAAQAQKAPDRVGRIMIEGNTETPDWFILLFVDLRPGQVLAYPKLDEARKMLVATRHFDRADPPAVEVIANEFDGVYKDVRVRVKERPGNGLMFAVLDTAEDAVRRPCDVLLRTAVAVYGALKTKRSGN